MTLCLVTDRRRLGGAPLELVRARLVELACRAAAAGVDMIQVRERDLEAAHLSALVTDILEGTARTGVRVVVNERLDVALACGAGGVHLRGDSIAVAAARPLTPPGFVIGRSVRSAEEAIRADGADYLVAGTVFPSASKPGATSWLGTDGLGAIVRATRAPVLAIGGVHGDGIEAVAAAGAAGFAAIGLFGCVDPSVADLRVIVNDARRRFDSVRTAP